MTDDIKLPPLPEPVAVIHGIRVWTIESMSNYEAAIKANLQQRGEPVAKVTSSAIYGRSLVFLSRHGAPHPEPGTLLYAAPQSAAPSQEPSDDAIGVLKLALEYWADRQQRYRNRAPVWVQEARALLARYGNRHVAQQSVPKGWKLVPEDPTEEMIVAFVEQWYCHKQTIDDPQMGDAYQAMLEAAPSFGEER